MRLQAFTWGYHGWGSEAEHFVRAVDTFEESRGFAPPMFVDLRLSREGRAKKFRGNAFASIVGPARYAWMPDLGNTHVESKSGPRIQIADPQAVETLLDQIIERHHRHQRVIIFCHCPEPLLLLGDGYPACHRVEVATLLLEAAGKLHLQLTMAEWPGTEPVSLRLQAGELQTRALEGGAAFIPIAPVEGSLPPTAVLGWGSTIDFSGEEQEWILLTGPAIVRAGYWRHGVINVSANELLQSGYGPRSTNAVPCAADWKR